MGFSNALIRVVESTPVTPSESGFVATSAVTLMVVLLGGGVVGTLVTLWARRGVTAAEEESLTVRTAKDVMEQQAETIEREVEKNRRMEDQLNQALRDIQDLRREVVDLREELNRERLDCDRKLAAMQNTIDQMKKESP